MFAPGAGRWIGTPLALSFILLAGMIGTRGAWFYAELAGFLVLIGLALFFAIFFRDPERAPGEGVVSAADGRVREVSIAGGRLRISVFMNVTDVHVNRLPVDATVAAVEDAGTGYRAAYRPDAEHNVQRRYRLATAIGPVEVVQMTGVVARRLVSFVRPGARGRKGDRFGMIVLGSRVDVLLPAERVDAAVKVGDRVWAGRSSIARERP